MLLVSHNDDFSATTTLKTFNPTSTSVNYWKKLTDVFSGIDDTTTYSLTTAQPWVSLVYAQDVETFSAPAQIEDSFDTFIEVANDVESKYQSVLLEYMTYQALIQKLLDKIYPSNTLVYSLTHTNYVPVLVADDCVRNIGTTDGTGKFTVKLSDVFNSLHILEFIGIDIQGNTMTIAPLASLYSSTKWKSLKSKNIAIKADVSHVYNKISVGYDTEKRDDADDLIYPFNCKKTFEIQETTAEGELNLVNPFHGDCYAIEKHFNEILDSQSNSEKSDICIIVCDNVPSFDPDDIDDSQTTGSMDLAERVTDTEVINLTTFTAGTYVSQVSNVATARYTAPVDGLYVFSMQTEINIINAVVGISFKNNGVSQTLTYDISQRVEDTNSSFYYEFRLKLEQDDEFDVVIEATQNISATADVRVISFTLFVAASDVQTYIYKDHTISGFTGISSTVYNVPITPKRILQKHLPYISVSNYQNPSEDIVFVSSELESAITSQCGYETSAIIENADVTSVTPIFLPSIISFDTQEKLSSLATVQSNKYKYIEIEDEKTGKIYAGWINNATFAVSKNQTQQWELQAKTI
jgi:hypothetical protein